MKALRRLAGIFAVSALVIVPCARPVRAQAGDLQPASPVAYPPDVYDWTGVYVGGPSGSGFAGSPFDGLDGASGRSDARPAGGVGRDFSWMNLAIDPSEAALATDAQWTSTASGRIEAAFARLLAYAEGAGSSRTGWIAEAGLKYAVSDDWPADIEYDYGGFGPQAMRFAAPAELAGAGASLAMDAVRGGTKIRLAGRQ